MELAHFNPSPNQGFHYAKCNRKTATLKRLRRREVAADFEGGRLTSDGGLLVLREVDERLGLLDAVNDAIPDPRDARFIVHEQRELLAQRIFAIAAGCEDENDHNQLRHDPALQVLASKLGHGCVSHRLPLKTGPMAYSKSKYFCGSFFPGSVLNLMTLAPFDRLRS